MSTLKLGDYVPVASGATCFNFPKEIRPEAEIEAKWKGLMVSVPATPPNLAVLFQELSKAKQKIQELAQKVDRLESKRIFLPPEDLDIPIEPKSVKKVKAVLSQARKGTFSPSDFED